jgi:purine-nucleoside/S-methyl-5'-thioadenosine phosphorylase / adenosine deaminase
MTLSPATAELLESPNVAHGFFGRSGGVSKGMYKDLNCGPGSNDNPLHVIENRSRVAAHFKVPSKGLLSLHQVHSNLVFKVNGPWPDERPQADAMVTKTPGLALSILTADCGSVLFSDPVAQVVGAAHAGWKGAFSGILEETIDAMVGLGATRENINAAIGPTISGLSYEVGPEFYDRFVGHLESNHVYFSPSQKPGHHTFDLPKFIEDRLYRAAIADCTNLSICTYTSEADYFSFRRTTHRKLSDYGRNISVIMLEPVT